MRFSSLLGLLLKHEGYPPAVVVTLLLHGTLIYFLLDRGFTRDEIVDVERPTYINASVIQENPQRLRRLEELERQRDAAQAERRREQEAERQRQQEAERQRAEREAQAAREQEQREAQARAEEQRRQELARQEREREAAEARARDEAARQQQLAREQAAREEAARQAQQQAAQAAVTARDAYIAVIRETISLNWSLPPNARNGMTVVVRIQLVPTGEVVDASVVQSSGDPAFDRSAEQAVLRAERFPELQDMDIGLFNEYFRTLNLLFRPEDLLR